MKILQLINRMPYPLNDGGSIGIHYYIEGFLNAGIQLSVLAMNTSRYPVHQKEKPQLYDKLVEFKAVDVDTHIKILPAFINLFQSSSYNINRFISNDYQKELIQLLQNNSYDIIQLESLFVTPYISTIRKYSKAKIVIRQHNIEFKIWERLSSKERNPLKKWYLKLLAKRLRNHEIQYLNQYDLVLPISENDAAILKELGIQKPMYVHPFGINSSKIPFQEFQPENPISLYHIGAMDWLPNQESVLYFIKNVMPLIAQKFPDLIFYVAGRSMPHHFFQNQSAGVKIVGEVPDAQEFEKDKAILVVPLQSGGGIRIKIFQALAMGKAIVTTSIGAEGIQVKDGEEIMIADSPEEFLEKITFLVNHPEKIVSLGQKARKLIEDKYNQVQLFDDLLNRYEKLIRE